MEEEKQEPEKPAEESDRRKKPQPQSDDCGRDITFPKHGW